jgi:hypothetical protein
LFKVTRSKCSPKEQLTCTKFSSLSRPNSTITRNPIAKRHVVINSIGNGPPCLPSLEYESSEANNRRGLRDEATGCVFPLHILMLDSLTVRQYLDKDKVSIQSTREYQMDNGRSSGKVDLSPAHAQGQWDSRHFSPWCVTFYMDDVVDVRGTR